ncbi:hypothetical protein RCL1_005787 [Eukaryota sp. TZLM3-RCL]
MTSFTESDTTSSPSPVEQYPSENPYSPRAFHSHWNVCQIDSSSSPTEVQAPPNSQLPFVGFALVTVISGKLSLAGIPLINPRVCISSLPFGPLYNLWTDNEPATFLLEPVLPDPEEFLLDNPLISLSGVAGFYPLLDTSRFSYTPFTIPLQWSDFFPTLTSARPLLYWICGQQGSGKSVFTGYLASYLAEIKSRDVYLIDLDCGQSLVGPPNCLTVSRVCSIISQSPIGNSVLATIKSIPNPIEVLKITCFGSNSPGSDPAHYTNIAINLLNFVLSVMKKETSIIVNTCGWTSGFGKELMTNLLTDYSKILESRNYMSVVPIVLAKPLEVPVWDDWISEISREVNSKTGLYLKYHVMQSIVVKELMAVKSVDDSISPVELDFFKLRPLCLREISTILWICQDQTNLIPTTFTSFFHDFISNQTSFSANDAHEWFLSHAYCACPFIVDLSSFSLISFAQPLHSTPYLTSDKISNEIALSRLGSTLNCNYIGLYYDSSITNQNRPIITSSLPATSQFVGLGMVRAYDCMSRKLYIIACSFTSIEELSKSNVLLVQIGFPISLLKFKGTGAHSCVLSVSPFVSAQISGAGSSVPKRKNTNRLWRN